MPRNLSPLTLGVASISFKTLSLEDALAAMRRFDLHSISLYKTHAPWGGDPAACRRAGEKVRAAGLRLTSTGVVTFPNDEKIARQAFDCARAAQLPMMACRPEPDAFPLLDRLVKEYDVKLAVHNHGPEDKLYPSPREAWAAVEHYDPRIGLCIDVGHCYRAGIDPVEAIQQHRARLYDLHIKDTVAPIGAEDIPVEIGRGHMNIRGILRALIDVGYRGQVGIEYEVEGPGKEDPRPGVAESLGYLRGVLASL